MQALAFPMAFEDRKPQLSPDWDPTRTEMTPSEGFLLSRIDGNTPWGQLLQIGGLPPEEVDRCLKRWLAEGLLTVDASAGGDRGAPAETDLTRAERRRIEEFERRLALPYHEILGVDRRADAKAIKRAYFALSKEFHPDRHFRRNLGSYRVRLEGIFRKDVEAYELLSDPMTRAQIEQTLGEEPIVTQSATPPPKRTGESPQAHLTPKRAALERMRRHFHIPEKVLVERKFKAKKFAQAAMVSSKRGNWLESAASIRLAIAFDPWNDEYKHYFAEVQAQVNRLRADELLRHAESSLDSRAKQDALQMYEEALSYRPCDPEINVKAAKLALELGENDAAREYAEAASELKSEDADTHALLGKVLIRTGLRDKAIEALKRALALQPEHEEAKAQLASINRNRSASSRRGSNQ
jgi:curved DNA-binding protein CbpA